MVAITVDFGRGGANLVASGAQGTPTLALALRDIADDLAGIYAEAGLSVYTIKTTKG